MSDGAGTWRLLSDDRQDGSCNMAVDEAILEGYETAPSPPPPTLRLYGWRPAALSLGKSQRAAGAHVPAALTAEAVDLVRRPTGGEAVLHEHERTYAVIGAAGTPPFEGGPVDVYRQIARALVSALRRLGLEATSAEPPPGPRAKPGAICFERTGAWEITVGGRKILGSSQFRKRRAFLQHGSLPWRLDGARLAALTGVRVDPTHFTDLESAMGRPVSEDEIDAAFVSAFEETFGIRLVKGALTESEALRAAELRCWKYDSMAWTLDAKLGDREQHWGPALGLVGS
ncbi:MAG TPA: lipoate--protein ligase family protein [Candidatus Polarisedimenticolaceae bacterium]|nr:lipoate--protein ligase family protein [Candidatus Polarisedimenticolaceae bacterium]